MFLFSSLLFWLLCWFFGLFFFLEKNFSPALGNFMNAAKGCLWAVFPLILHLKRTEKAKVLTCMRWQRLWAEALCYTCPASLCCCCCCTAGREIASKLISVAAAMIGFESFRLCSSAAKWDQPKHIKRLPSSLQPVCLTQTCGHSLPAKHLQSLNAATRDGGVGIVFPFPLRNEFVPSCCSVVSLPSM